MIESKLRLCITLYAAAFCVIEVVRARIDCRAQRQHVCSGRKGRTPFDAATGINPAGEQQHAFIMERYCQQMIQEHGRLALHAIIGAAEYSIAQVYPPYNPLQIRLRLSTLTLQHFRILLSTLDTELIHNRGDSGKLPIKHIACRIKSPVEVLALVLEHDALDTSYRRRHSRTTTSRGMLFVNCECHLPQFYNLLYARRS